MDKIKSLLETIKKEYDNGKNQLQGIEELSIECLSKLKETASSSSYKHKDKTDYIVLSNNKNRNTSRPIRKNLFISDPVNFKDEWTNSIKSSNPKLNKLDGSSDSINKAIYTAIIAFSACYDLWKPASRKTPGTYFEIVLGSIIGIILPDYTRKKFVVTPDNENNVSTDIVFEKNGKGLVIPAKITTRERIVQPFAHQRVLDSIFGEDRYISVLMCISETQKANKKKTVNDICVPGTIKQFSKHISKLGGLYYTDPPTRYLAADVKAELPVADYGSFFTSELSTVVKKLEQ